ncbi:HNH endonuclease signature motif containing protein [Mycolicibacterium chlorophenolicum]|uniref:HNH endonuclease signature motif containing protein n=2 Tax=Mycolicibacterium chlorophenolicum TaxID=37916 RepID=UPI000767790E|nr:HNH endonuclease signature motif containing protein [Mycolicibacterium chlorophenolicum]
MYDSVVPPMASLAGAGDADLVDIVAGCGAAAARAEAVKLAAIVEFWERRQTPARARWACDDWDAAAAEIGCALNISSGRASGQMTLGLALRDRFPRLGRLLAAGRVPLSLVTTIVFRAALVVDPAVLARLDRVFVDAAREWGLLSQKKLETAIDVWIDRYDPDAVRRLRTGMAGRSFTLGNRDDRTGLTSAFGKLATPDAAALAHRLSVMVHSVCENDPRTLDQRRADSLGAMAAGSFVLSCRCGNSDCPSGQVDDGRGSSFTITVIAEPSALDATVDPHLHGEPTPEPAPEAAEPEPDSQPAPHPSPEPARRTAALIPGFGSAVVPAPLLAELIAHGATVRFLTDPAALGATAGYRPCAALERFVRARDLTCRFPGCDRPAVFADIDHTQPYPHGATHASNTKCYCRQHHLVKTFWEGWTDTQTADGTVRVTTPTGHTYTTKPFSSLLFPSWNTTTGPPPPSGTTPPRRPGRSLMMPTRGRTRAQNRAARITRERELNALQRQHDRNAKPQPQQHNTAITPEPDCGDDPPPF